MNSRRRVRGWRAAGPIAEAVLIALAMATVATIAMSALSGELKGKPFQPPLAVARQYRGAGRMRLVYALVLMRHGVRSPTWPRARLDAFSIQPWPRWPAPPGYLTPHGARLIRQLGGYYRALFRRLGLLGPGCDAEHVWIRADVDQRTRATGRAMGAGLSPGCPVVVHTVSGRRDLLFHPSAAEFASGPRRQALAAVLRRAGGSGAAFQARYARQLRLLTGVLAPAGRGDPRNTFLRGSTVIGLGHGDDPVRLSGPVDRAASFAEDFLLEYAEDMPMARVGWGRLPLAKLRVIRRLHSAASELTRRTPAVARMRAAHLVAAIGASLRQAVSGRPVAGAVGGPRTRLLVLVGHDTNISNVGGALGIAWKLAAAPPNCTPPGGALVWELWRHPGPPRHGRVNGAAIVRVVYIAQSLWQMRHAIRPTLASPPLQAPANIGACGGNTCSLRQFLRILRTSVGQP